MEDQVKVEVLSSNTETGSADKLTVGVGVVGVGVLPPPPPPQQPARMKVETIMDRLRFFIYMFYINT